MNTRVDELSLTMTSIQHSIHLMGKSVSASDVTHLKHTPKQTTQTDGSQSCTPVAASENATPNTTAAKSVNKKREVDLIGDEDLDLLTYISDDEYVADDNDEVMLSHEQHKSGAFSITWGQRFVNQSVNKARKTPEQPSPTQVVVHYQIIFL